MYILNNITKLVANLRITLNVSCSSFVFLESLGATTEATISVHVVLSNHSQKCVCQNCVHNSNDL